MPKIVALAAYAIKVWNIGEREFDDISDFGEGIDLLDVVKDSFRELKVKASRNSEHQQVLKVRNIEVAGRRICGIIETGEYGQESELWDVNSEKTVYKRKTTEANMLPFYFRMEIPQGVDQGILLLQRTGMYGIRKIVKEFLDHQFDKRFMDSRLRFNHLIEREEIEKYQKGLVESIRFISYDIPRDIADAFDSGHQEDVGHLELSIHAKRGSSVPILRKLREFYSGKTKLSKLIALDETNFKYSDIKVRSKVGRSSRTLDLGDLNRLRSYYDITDEIEFDSSGHPDFTSIDKAAGDLTKRLIKHMGSDPG
jgi:hypothetical protein